MNVPLAAGDPLNVRVALEMSTGSVSIESTRSRDSGLPRISATVCSAVRYVIRLRSSLSLRMKAGFLSIHSHSTALFSK